jgi:N-acetylmuramoyl-L-alanine amidase
VVVAVVIAALLLGTAGIVVGLAQLRPAEESVSERAAADTSLAIASEPSVDTTRAVEVPDVVGSSAAEARIVLEAAGFSVRVSDNGARSTAEIVRQQPNAGALLSPGATIRLVTAAPASAPTPEKKKGSEAAEKPAEQFVVCVDPGHQERSDSTPEPIGPGSKETKPSVTGGTTGVETRLAEYEAVLQISMNLKKRLEAQGVKVVMTRTTNDVNLSNSQRAAIANKAHADLFVRVHADGNPSSELAGISTLYPGPNRWTRPIVAESKRAAKSVQHSVVVETGAIDRGAVPRTDLSGFNYSKVPAVLIECGFMSNPVEDRLLASPHYQDKLASGIASGVVAYLRSAGE